MVLDVAFLDCIFQITPFMRHAHLQAFLGFGFSPPAWEKSFALGCLLEKSLERFVAVRSTTVERIFVNISAENVVVFHTHSEAVDE